jgi:hypothetical protein
MSKIPYYKISTSLKKTNQYKEKKGFWYNRKRTQLVLGVLGVYLVASGVLGFLMFGNRNPDIAKASESANVSSSIRFVSEKEFTVGDNVEVILTLQNTSVTEPINDLSVDFLSTKDSIKWNKLSVRSSAEQVTASNQIGSFNIPSLGLGERAEYLLTGTYQNSDLDFLIILGKLRYTNDIGIQNIDTNRIYTNLKPDQDEKSKPFLLSVNSPRVAQGENLILTLDGRSPEIPLTSKDKGKIYISRKTSGEVVATFDCLPEEKGQCQFTSNNIGVGEYSAIFLNEEIGTASTIAAFSVGGTPEANALVPSEQANLVLPFGNKSINGLIPVIAQRVITQNQSPDKSTECVFDVIKDGKVLVSNKSKIEDDRSCRTEFTFEQFKASGIYKIKLNNSNLENEVSVVEKAPGLLTIQNLTPNTQKNQNIQIKVENINDAQNQPVNDDEVTISIYQKQNGSVEKINTISGDKIKILAGKLEATLEGKYFSNGGTYLVYFESKSGKTSDFLTVNFSDSNVAFSNSGILIEDYSKLKVGSDFGLKIQGITNKDGGLVSGGSCTANLYSVSSGALPVAIEGKITGGICEVLVGKGKVNKSGPLLISFNSNNSAISLNQSKQLQIAPGDPVDFGGINLEYEPALSDFANSAIIGPVVDEYSNPTTSFGNTLFIKKENGEIIKEIPEVSITNGFAKILLPSSTITGNKIILSLTDKAGVEKLTKEYSIKTTQTNLSFPNIADSIKNDSPIDISAKNVTEDSTDFCTVKFTRSAKEFIEEKIPYQKDEDVCNLSWNLNRFRDTSQALIEVSVSNQKYNKIINLKPSEPANLFSIHSQARFNSQKELQISLASSPIVDIQGMPVNSGQTTWQYNGKIEKADIVDGFAKLDLTASQLESRDIRTKLDERYLDLDIDVEASITSISQTNNVSVYLGQFDLSNQKGDFAIKSASNYISSQYPKIFRFLGDSCNAFVLSNSNSTSTNLKSYKKGKECLVEVIAPVGKNTLIFEDNGFILGKLDFVVANETQEVDWCGDQDCELIQVKAPINSKIEAIIYDDQNQYKFEAGELENIIKVKQNGLNPLKEYLVEIRYKDASGNSVSHFNTILGENLISK